MDNLKELYDTIHEIYRNTHKIGFEPYIKPIIEVNRHSLKIYLDDGVHSDVINELDAMFGQNCFISFAERGRSKMIVLKYYFKTKEE